MNLIMNSIDSSSSDNYHDKKFNQNNQFINKLEKDV
jgi:hypothetical protein